MQYIKIYYLDMKKDSESVEVFSSAKKSQASIKSKQKLRVISGRKNSTFTNVSHIKNGLSDFTNVGSLSSYKEDDDK